MNDSILIVKHFCHECNQEIDVISDHKCGLCNSSFIEELSGAKNNLTESEDQSKASGSEGTPVKDNDCPICLVPMTVTKDDPLIVLKCQHKYHKPCIKGWFEGHNTCPLCRDRVNVSSFVTPKRQNVARRGGGHHFAIGRDVLPFDRGEALERMERARMLLQQMVAQAGQRDRQSHRPQSRASRLFMESAVNSRIRMAETGRLSRGNSAPREEQGRVTEHRLWRY